MLISSRRDPYGARVATQIQTTPAERSLRVRLGAPLGHVVREFEAFYNTVRPHQGIENRPIGVVPFGPAGTGPPGASEIECEARLGGLLRHYRRKAA